MIRLHDGSIFVTDLDVTRVPTTSPQEAQAARLTVCDRARDVADAHLLLAALGLTEVAS